MWQLMDERANSKLTFAYVAKLNSFLWKSSHFHVKRYAQALDLKKRETLTRKWKSAYEPSGPSGRRLFRFL